MSTPEQPLNAAEADPTIHPDAPTASAQHGVPARDEEIDHGETDPGACEQDGDDGVEVGLGPDA